MVHTGARRIRHRYVKAVSLITELTQQIFGWAGYELTVLDAVSRAVPDRIPNRIFRNLYTHHTRRHLREE